MAPADGGDAFSARLVKIGREFGSLIQDTGGLRGLENLINERLALQEDVRRKEAELKNMKDEAIKAQTQREDDVQRLEKEKAKIKSSLDILIAKFETRYGAWDKDKMRYEAESVELSRLRPLLDSAVEEVERLSTENRKLVDKLDRLGQENENQRDSIETLRSKLQRRQLKLNETNSELEKCRTVLTQLQEDLGILPFDNEKVAKDFEELSTKVHQIAWKYFGDEMPSPAVLIGGLPSPLSQIPQLSTASSAARLMRIAVAEAIVAQELSESVFQEFHSLKKLTGIEENTLGKIIDTLAETHPLQAAIVRCQITKVCNGSAEIAAIPAHSVERVATVLGAWIGDDGPRKKSFLEELGVIFSDAMSLWQPLQLSSKKVTARVDLSNESWFEGEDRREAYDEANDGTSTQLEDGRVTSTILGPMAVLFPQILADNQELFHGYALFHTQHAVMAAAQENASQQDQQRQGVHRRRRASNRDQTRSEQNANSPSIGTVRYNQHLSNASSELSYMEQGVTRAARGGSRTARSATE